MDAPSAPPQQYHVQVPEGIGPGMPFYAQVGNGLVLVTCPVGAQAGTLIAIATPGAAQPLPPIAVAQPAAAPGAVFVPPYAPPPQPPAYESPYPIAHAATYNGPDFANLPTAAIFDVDEPYASETERLLAAKERRCAKVNQMRPVNACYCCLHGWYCDDNVVCGSWQECCCVHFACCCNAKKDDDDSWFLRCGCCDISCARCGLRCRGASHFFFCAQAHACPPDRLLPAVCGCLGMTCCPVRMCCARVDALKMKRMMKDTPPAPRQAYA